MDCSEVREFVDIYVDAELAELEREGFEKHLVTCPDCRQLVDAEGEFRALFKKKLPTRTCPPHIRQSVLETIEQEGESRRKRRRLLWVPVAAAASVLLFVSLRSAPLPGSDTVTEPARSPLAAGTRALSAPSEAPPRPPTVRAGTFQNTAFLPSASGAISVASYLRLPADVEGGEQAIQRYMEPRIPFYVAPPLHTSTSVRLLGARQVEVTGAPGVLYFYEVRGKHLNVAVSRATPADMRHPELSVERERGLSVARLVRLGLRHVFVSELEPGDLSRLLRRALR